jgi:polyhydroxyalkanoate synthase
MPLELDSDELVEQVVEGQERRTLRKQLLWVPGEPRLAVVRKTLPEGPTRRTPVVLVHGFAQNRYSWHLSRRSLVNWLASHGWEVLNLELRGHGRSRPRQGVGERFEDYVEDLARLREHLGRAPFVIGHSLGGAVGYAAAAEGVDLAGVIGLGALYRFGNANGFLGLLARLSWAGRHGVLVKGLGVRTRLAGWVMGRTLGMTDLAGYALPISGWWPGSIEEDLLQERLVRGFDWTSAQVWLDMCEWSVRRRFHPYEEAWSRCTTPVLVVVGDEDHLMPLGDARPAFDVSGAEDKQLLVLEPLMHETHWGHLDLVLGRLASTVVWPRLDAWMAQRDEGSGSSSR